MTPGIVELDLHGRNVWQARTAVDAALRRAKGAYRIRVIHGYHGGTALRDAIRGRYGANGKVKRVELGLNPGQTDLILREF